jgi:hypothetical protein
LWRNGKELTAKGVKLAGAWSAAGGHDRITSSHHRSCRSQNQQNRQWQRIPHQRWQPAVESAAAAELVASRSIPHSAPNRLAGLSDPIPVDLDRLKTAAAKFDIEIRKSKGYGFEMALDQLLMALTTEAPQSEAEPTITQAVSAQAKTLEFLTTEVESLRSQLAKANQERDQAIDQLAAIDQQQADFTALQAENQRLKSAHTSLMQAYNQLLANGQKQLIAPLPNSTTTQNDQVEQPLPRAKTTPKRVSAADGGAIARAVRLFRAVQDWNDQHPHATFAITASLLKRDFGIHDKAIEAFFADHQQEVDDYHQSIGVGNVRSHNRQSGRDVEQLKQLVQTVAEG